MPSVPESVALLVSALRRLPGIGPRSAERLALYLVQADEQVSTQLAEALLESRRRVCFCEACGGLSESPTCLNCADPRRDSAIVCVVERPVDIFSVEKAGSFKGKYHVLGGKISPLNGVEPEGLRIAQLEERLTKEPIRELVIALGSDVEGDATSFYLAKRLARQGLKITRIAHGLPAGSGLEFADEVTLNRALEGRREI